MLRMILALHLLDLAFGIVVNHDPKRPQYAHHPLRVFIQFLTDTMLQHGQISRTISLGYAQHFTYVY